MTIGDYIYKNKPKYYPNMYLDGYSPYEIREAVIRDMREQLHEEPESYEIHIISEVKFK